MNKTAVGIIAVLVVVGAYYFITKNNSAGAPAAPVSDASAAAEAAVSIQNFSFNPSALSVKTGTTVTWTNNDTVAHTVTSDSGELLNSPTLAPGQSFSFTFVNPETAAYHCAVHPMMKGTVSVGN